ncbi:MAG: hypothetical protein ACRD3P_03595 [Terriglobales bacterium]
MKNCFFVLAICILASVGAAGQTAGSYFLNGEPQMLVMPEHPQHASQTPLAQEQDLRERSTYAYAQGERPAWEFMPTPAFVPLAPLARTLRDEHARAKKAVVIRND